jgi:fibronectin type 3 domain-containing protein
VDGAWTGVGGTSCAAPLWAAFTAIVNQARAAIRLSPLGFPNPALYDLSEGPDYAVDFHDIADNSTNQYYIAVPGYDDATGLGSFNGANLLADLSSADPPAVNPQGPPTVLVTAPAQAPATGIVLSWTGAAQATSYNILRSVDKLGPYAAIGTSTTTTYTDSSAGAGPGDFYVVTASGPDGVSPNSAISNSAPILTPTNLVATATGSSQIKLTWTAYSKAISYTVLRANAPVAPATVPGPYAPVGNASYETYTDSNLTPDTTYYYMVTGLTMTGSTLPSNSADATTTTMIPLGLYAQAMGTTTINLTWTPTVGATGYNILRGTASGGPYAQIGTSIGATYADSGLTAATPYYYVVQSTNGAIVSADSAEATTTTLAVAPANVVATAIGTSQIGLTWNASVGAVSYIVLRGTASGGPYQFLAQTVLTSYNDSGLAPVTTYYYVVRANTAGGASANSAQADATTLAPAPNGLKATALSSTQIGLSWNTAKGAVKYYVLRGMTASGPFAQAGVTASPSYTDTGLSPGTAYYYVVSANLTAGSSARSAAAAAVTAMIAPTGLTAMSTGSTGIALKWLPCAGASSYRIERSTTHGGPYVAVGSSVTASYSDSGLKASTTYYYVVAPANSVGVGPISVAATAKTAIAPPAAPTKLTVATVAKSTTELKLTWNASSGATSYAILRAASATATFAEIATTSSTQYTNTGLSASTKYYYMVSAANAGGSGAFSNVASGKP